RALSLPRVVLRHAVLEDGHAGARPPRGERLRPRGGAGEHARGRDEAGRVGDGGGGGTSPPRRGAGAGGGGRALAFAHPRTPDRRGRARFLTGGMRWETAWGARDRGARDSAGMGTGREVLQGIGGGRHAPPEPYPCQP